MTSRSSMVSTSRSAAAPTRPRYHRPPGGVRPRSPDYTARGRRRGQTPVVGLHTSRGGRGQTPVAGYTPPGGQTRFTADVDPADQRWLAPVARGRRVAGRRVIERVEEQLERRPRCARYCGRNPNRITRPLPTGASTTAARPFSFSAPSSQPLKRGEPVFGYVTIAFASPETSKAGLLFEPRDRPGTGSVRNRIARIDLGLYDDPGA